MAIRDILVNGRLGFGTAPLGNMFRDIPDDEAAATVDAAWEHGTRFFDTAPMYGAGLAEIRLGKYLAKHDRDDYVLAPRWVGSYWTRSIPTSATPRCLSSDWPTVSSMTTRNPVH
jgi:aryl-alcohol dehydrogenase-like predicted oxidoreductase